MTDRELLELAAKAAGIDGVYRENGYAKTYGINYHMDAVLWNPLTDDGDALRLAVKLGIEFGYGYDVSEDRIQRVIIDDNLHVIVDENGPYAATRLAIVRAAAELGSK